MGNYLLVAALAIAAIVFISKTVFVVQQHQRGVVATFGRYSKTVNPGLVFVFPFVQTLRFVDMRETVLDVSPQDVITKDNAMVTVDAVVYYEVTDPFRNVYNVVDFIRAAMKLAQTNLRNVIGDLELDEALTSRETINVRLREILDDATDKWGVRITRVEIQTIEPPRDITEAMSRQMKAERDKRAAILEAEGIKQAAILQAEGQKQSAILRAEGEAEAIQKVAEADRFRELTVAKGEAQAIETVFSAIHTGRPTKDLLAVKYLETLGQMADGKATKIFLPIESSSVLSGIAAAGIAFKEGMETVEPGGPDEGEQAAEPPVQN